MKRNSKRPGESCRGVCLCSPQSRLFCTVAVNYVEYWWNHVQSCGEKLVRTCGKPPTRPDFRWPFWTPHPRLIPV